MEENLPVPIKNEIVFGEDKQFYTRKRRRRRKKEGKLRKCFKRLLVLLIFGALTYCLVKNYNTINSYLNNLFSKEHSSISTNQIIDKSDMGEDNYKDESSDNGTNFEFIDTFPDEFQISNESKHVLTFEEGSVNLPSVNEIYNTYSQDAPVVLIVHFSPLEAYASQSYDSSANNFYSESDNVAKVGRYITEKLNEKGINALHIESYGEFSTLYEGKEAFIQRVKDTLNENPSISYVIDISRGLSINSDLSINNEAVSIDGIKYPTIQLWCGVGEAELGAEQKQSLYFARCLAEYINSNSPLLVSKLTATKYDSTLRFPCTTIRADIGTYACSYEDALLSAEQFAIHLADFLNK